MRFVIDVTISRIINFTGVFLIIGVKLIIEDRANWVLGVIEVLNVFRMPVLREIARKYN